MLKGRKFFDVTNLGGELVWYTLILIYFVLRIFWFCNHLHTLYVVSIYDDDDECVSFFISYVLFLFSLYTHVSFLFNLSLFSMVPWCVLFSAFQERQVKAKSRFRVFFLQQLLGFKYFRLGLFCNLE